MISYGIQLFNDFIGFNISWTQFASHPKPLDALSWQNFEKNFIAYLKVQRASSFVRITLLPALGSLNMLSNSSYCFNDFLDYFGAYDQCLIQVTPAWQGSTLSLVESLKRGYFDDSLTAIVIRKLDQ